MCIRDRVKVAPELWSITDESGAAVTELTDGVLYDCLLYTSRCV